MKKAGTSPGALAHAAAERVRMARPGTTSTRRLSRLLVSIVDPARRTAVYGVDLFPFGAADLAEAEAKLSELRASGRVARLDRQYVVETLPAGCRVPRERHEWEIGEAK